jgi:hypothetical protein
MPTLKHNDPDLAPPETLVQVTAPHFCAGIVIRQGKCVEAAPILAWCVGKSRGFLSNYFHRKRWRAVIKVAKPVPTPLKNLPPPAAQWPQSRVSTSRAEAIVKGDVR